MGIKMAIDRLIDCGISLGALQRLIDKENMIYMYNCTLVSHKNEIII